MPAANGICAPVASLAALVDRIDSVGIVEHARGPNPSPEFGHCTDDAGRALGLAGQLADDPRAATVAVACLGQLEASLRCDGRFTLRLDAEGWPTRDPLSDDADARAAWGLAAAATSALADGLRQRAVRLLAELSGFETDHPRAAAHAVLAGATMLRAHPGSAIGRRLIAANRDVVPRPARTGDWRWPEPRLSYGNGLIVEALLDLAELDGDDDQLADALELLDWLIGRERADGGHFSFTPAAGRGPGEPGGFDQQPIEAWTLASACARAYAITGAPVWAGTCRQVVRWFDGHNDHGIPMWDRRTGGAYDGLTANGVNENQGTESTMALIGSVRTLEATAQRVPMGRRSSSRWVAEAVAAPT